MAFCPEDRKAEGILGELTVRENIILALQTKRGGCGCCRRANRTSWREEMIKALGIATPDADKPVGQLSGGNQQKVMLAAFVWFRTRACSFSMSRRAASTSARTRRSCP